MHMPIFDNIAGEGFLKGGCYNLNGTTWKTTSSCVPFTYIHGYKF